MGFDGTVVPNAVQCSRWQQSLVMAEIPVSTPLTVGTPGPGEGSGEGAPSDEQVRVQLGKILASSALRGSERLRRFLRLVVEDTLSGQGDRLKEYVLGVEVLERPASFDPRADPVVRVEARRLRAKLADYYQTEGQDDDVVIEFLYDSAATPTPHSAAH